MDREVAAAVESEVARNAEELEVELEAEPEPALAVENDDDEEDGDASPSAPQEGGGPVDALAQIRAGVLRLVDLCDSELAQAVAQNPQLGAMLQLWGAPLGPLQSGGVVVSLPPMQGGLHREVGRRVYVPQRQLIQQAATLSPAQLAAATEVASLAGGGAAMTTDLPIPPLRELRGTRDTSGLRQRVRTGELPIMEQVEALMAGKASDLAMGAMELQRLVDAERSMPQLRRSLALRTGPELKAAASALQVGRSSGSKGKLIQALVEWLCLRLDGAAPTNALRWDDAQIVDVAVPGSVHTDVPDVLMGDWVLLTDRGDGSMDDAVLVRGWRVRMTHSSRVLPAMVHFPRAQLQFLVPGKRVEKLLQSD